MRAPDPGNAIIRALLARSGNQCAFPDCTHPLVNEGNVFIAHLCHIEAASPGGPRFTSGMSDEERRAYGNLLFLCYRHHVETDNVQEYPVDALRSMKARHESRFLEHPFAAPETVVEAVARQATAYWTEVTRRNRDGHVAPDLRMDIDTSAEAPALFLHVRKVLDDLESVHDWLREADASLSQEVRVALSGAGYDLQAWDAISYYRNPTSARRNFELLQLSLRNLMGRISILVDQIELRHLETAVALNSSDPTLRERLKVLRAHVLGYAANVGHAD